MSKIVVLTQGSGKRKLAVNVSHVVSLRVAYKLSDDTCEECVITYVSGESDCVNGAFDEVYEALYGEAKMSNVEQLKCCTVLKADGVTKVKISLAEYTRLEKVQYDAVLNEGYDPDSINDND